MFKRMLGAVLLLLTLAACGAPAEQLPEDDATPTPAPTMVSSDVTFRYSGGDDGCRYIDPQRLVTFAGQTLIVALVAGSGGPYNFTLTDADGRILVDVAVGSGETVYTTLVLDPPGTYSVYDRQRTEVGVISKVTARPRGQPGASVADGWCNGG